MEGTKDLAKEKLLEIKNRVFQQIKYDTYDSTCQINTRFSDFVYSLISQRQNPHEFSKMISSCYSILKWVLIKNEVVKNKSDMSYYLIIVDYLQELNINVSPFQESENEVRFYRSNEKFDNNMIAKICLNLYQKYIKFYLDNKRNLACDMSIETFYLQMELYQVSIQQRIETLYNSTKSFKLENKQYFMNDEELQSDERVNMNQRVKAGKKVMRYFISEINNTGQTLPQLQKKESEVDISQQLEEYRQRKLVKSQSSKDSAKEKLFDIKNRVFQQNKYDANDSTCQINTRFSDFVYSLISQRYNPHEFSKMISQCYSILKWILIKNEVVKNKSDMYFYQIMIDYLKELNINVSPFQESENEVRFYSSNDKFDRNMIAKICLNLYEKYIKFYQDNKKKLASGMSIETFYLQMELNSIKIQQRKETFYNSTKSFKVENKQYFMSDEELQYNDRVNMNQRIKAGKKVMRYFISEINNTGQTLPQLQKKESEEDSSQQLEEYRLYKLQKSQHDERQLKLQYEENKNKKMKMMLYFIIIIIFISLFIKIYFKL